MTDFVKGQVERRGHDHAAGHRETVQLLLKVSPACVIPEIQFIRPADDM